jgi:predicted  nucleic acid-binding Zn-ribbon protein
MRGKNGQAASVRREAAAVESEITTYRRKVRELAEELAAVRQQQITEREAASRERRALRAELAEGISPELAARDNVIADLRDELGRVRGEAVKGQNGVDQSMRLLHAILQQTGMSYIEAREWIARRIEAAATHSSLPPGFEPSREVKQAAMLSVIEIANIRRGLSS